MGTSERPPGLRLFTEGRALDIKKLAGRKVGTCVETEPVKKKKDMSLFLSLISSPLRF